MRLTYHSTAIEGNTLTQSETQMVLEKGITVGGKTLAEHLEVVGHRDAMAFVAGLARAGTPVGEREIREIHALVMRGVERGEGGAYRTLDVMAAGTEHRYPSWLKVAGDDGRPRGLARRAGRRSPRSLRRRGAPAVRGRSTPSATATGGWGGC